MRDRWPWVAGLFGLSAGALLMRPGRYFSWSELTTTSQDADNTPDVASALRLVYLARMLLDPLREHAGALRVTSGYRSREVNDLVGGASQSHHLTGTAADLYDADGEKSNVALATWLYGQTDLPIAEVVVEEHTGHLHVAVDTDGAPGARSFLRFDGEDYYTWTP